MKSKRFRVDRRSCGKRRFMSATEAQMALLRIQGYGSRDVVPVRFYECPLCHGWHLTSKPMREESA